MTGRPSSFAGILQTAPERSARRHLTQPHPHPLPHPKNYGITADNPIDPALPC